LEINPYWCSGIDVSDLLRSEASMSCSYLNPCKNFLTIQFAAPVFDADLQ